MEKVSRSIFYKEKESLRVFLGKEDSLERDFLDKLRKRPFMQALDNASVNILRLFNNACYICTLVYEEDYPLLELNMYEKIAVDNHDDPIWFNHMYPATMALVVCWLRSDECLKISEEREKQKDIEELCKGICQNIEEHNALPNEGIEDFYALISYDHRHPSKFIEERSFLRRPLAEAVEDKSVNLIEVLDSMFFLADVIKNNPDEFTNVFGPESYFVKQLPKMSFNASEMITRLAEWCKKIKNNDTKEEPTVTEQAFNAQTGLPRFTSRQIAIIAYALCKKGNVIPKNKKNIAPLFQRLTGHSSNVIGQNLSRYSDEEIEEIAAIIESDMPEFAKYLREKKFFLPEKEK